MIRRLLVVSLVVAGAAFAGDRYIGTISSGGAAANNRASSNDAGFVVPQSTKLSVSCLYDAYMVIDSPSAATSTTGVVVYSSLSVPFPTSSGGMFSVTLDGGANAPITTIVSILPVDGGVNSCRLFTRLGTE